MTLAPQAGSPMSPAPTPQAAPSSSTTLTSKLNPKNLVEAYQLERKKEEWARWVENEYQRCKVAREPFERQWYINLAFYQGKHYVAPIITAGTGFRLTAPKAPPWRVRIVINKIRMAMRTETAKLTSNKAIPIVVPATGEDEDASAARVAEAILKAEFNTAEFDKTFHSYIWWGALMGVSYLKSYWNANEVDEDAQKPPIPNPVFDLGIPGAPETIPAPVVKGKICVERVNPFHIYVPDLLTEEIDNQPYVIHVTTRSPLWVQRNFGFTPNADTKATNTIMDSAILIAKGGSQSQMLDSVLVKELWLRPNAHPDFPEGGVLTVINNKVVQCVKKWPWPFKEYPFYKYDGIPNGGFYGASVIEDLIPLNKEYNRTRSQMIEIKNTVGKPKFLYAQGSVDPRRITSEPGQGIPYVLGMPAPTPIQGVEVPQSMHMELDRLNSDFDDISGQHEISRGNTPSQVTSGTAISYLQEQDDTKLAYQFASIEHAIQKLGRHYLKYVSHYWDDERMVKVVGKDNDFEVKHWKGSDLRGNTDVRVQSGSALPFSKAAKQALVTEMMTNGWLAPEVGMEMMEMGGLDKAINEMLVDKRQAQRENLKMATLPVEEAAVLMEPPPNPMTGQIDTGPDGKPLDGAMTAEAGVPVPFQPQPIVQVNSWDNHEAHILWHNQFRKTQEFELLDDVLKQNFELHVQAHQMAMAMPQMGAAGIVANEQPPPMEGEEEVAEGEPENLGEGEGSQPPPQ